MNWVMRLSSCREREKQAREGGDVPPLTCLSCEGDVPHRCPDALETGSLWFFISSRLIGYLLLFHPGDHHLRAQLF